MAPHPSTLAWKIPWTEEPGRLRSMGRWGSDTTERLHFHFSLSCIGEGNGNPLQCSCLENPRDRGAWWASVYGVTQSRTRLKRLRSSSSSRVNTRLVSLWPLWHYHCLFPLLYWPIFPVSICIFLPSIGFPLDTRNYSLSPKYYFYILWLFYGSVLFLLFQSKSFVHSLSPSSNFILCMKSSWNNDQYSIPPFETLTLLFIPNQ